MSAHANLGREALLLDIAAIDKRLVAIEKKRVEEVERRDVRLDQLAPIISPVQVGDRLLFERRVAGDRIGYGYRSESGPDRYQPECWEVTEIGASRHGRFDYDDDPIDLHWTASLVRIVKGGERGKSNYSLLCREGEMSLPHLYESFKLGSALRTAGLLKIENVRNFRIVPAAEDER